MTEQTNNREEWPEGLAEQLVAWRRHLHRHPELSFQEENTARFVTDTLASFGGLELSHPTPTSVVARLTGAKPGKILALRADMDALPILEENEFEFASGKPGVMHACGHDGHTAMLLAAARLLTERRDKLHGEIRFIFQHAEELPPGGAIELVEAGVMDGVDWVFGEHLASQLPVGQIGIAYGDMAASPDNFTIFIKGYGGHAGFPHRAVDTIAVGAQIVANVQHIVSRYTNPLDRLVVSVTQFTAGASHNVIPDTAILKGTVRSFESRSAGRRMNNYCALCRALRRRMVLSLNSITSSAMSRSLTMKRSPGSLKKLRVSWSGRMPSSIHLQA